MRIVDTFIFQYIYINNTFQRCKLLNREICITGIEENGWNVIQSRSFDISWLNKIKSRILIIIKKLMCVMLSEIANKKNVKFALVTGFRFKFYVNAFPPHFACYNVYYSENNVDRIIYIMKKFVTNNLII